MRRIDRDLLIAGPLGLNRLMVRNPLSRVHSSMCAARRRARVARRYNTKDTPTDLNARTRTNVLTSHLTPERTTARACVVARPSVRPPAHPPARPPARPSVRPRACGEVRHVPDLAGFVAAIIAVVPVVVVTHIVAVIGSGGGIMEC